MSKIQVSIKPTEIKKVEFQAPANVVPGQPMNLELKSQAKVLLNMSAPLTAVVEVSFSATCPDDPTVNLEVVTVTGVTVSSFIDNLDQVIQSEYMPGIMLAVNEKLKQVTSVMGINLRLPSMAFSYGKDE